MARPMDSEVIDSKALQYVLVKPKDYTPDGSWPLVILMHGFGAHMYDLADLAPAIDQEGYVYAFPNAPYEMGGMVGYSWSLDRPGVLLPDDPGPGIDERLEAFTAEVKKATNVADGNIILGGFSQGGGLTLSHGLLHPEVFKGLIVLSASFRSAPEVEPKLPEDRGQRIFMTHGRSDPLISIAQAHENVAFLEGAGYSPEYHEYEMAHSISYDAIRDLIVWLHATIPPRKT